MNVKFKFLILLFLFLFFVFLLNSNVFASSDVTVLVDGEEYNVSLNDSIMEFEYKAIFIYPRSDYEYYYYYFVLSNEAFSLEESNNAIKIVPSSDNQLIYFINTANVGSSVLGSLQSLLNYLPNLSTYHMQVFDINDPNPYVSVLPENLSYSTPETYDFFHPAPVVEITAIQQVEEIPQVMEQVLQILIPIGLIVFSIGLVIYLTRLVISRLT